MSLFLACLVQRWPYEFSLLNLPHSVDSIIDVVYFMKMNSDYPGNFHLKSLIHFHLTSLDFKYDFLMKYLAKNSSFQTE